MRMEPNKHILRWFVVIAGLIALTSAVLSVPPASSAPPALNMERYRALVAIVNRNLGFAHFTRGVNVCTVLALRDAVTPADTRVLSAMLHDEDRLVSMAAAKTLGSMGGPGTAVLRSARNSPDERLRLDIQDALTTPLDGTLDHYRESGECNHVSTWRAVRRR